MDEREFTLLRKRLDALSFVEPFDAPSAPLVQRLCDELVRTTDSYRGLKLQCAKQAQEISTFNTKVRLCSRLVQGPARAWRPRRRPLPRVLDDQPTICARSPHARIRRPRSSRW
jgi:hypothetical protein